MHDEMEPIERMISRQLDAELTPEQELELNRALIRDPQAHRLMEETERADALSSAALAELFRDSAGRGPSSYPTVREQARPRAPRSSRWLIPGAIAAALLAMLIPFPGNGPVSEPARPVGQENPSHVGAPFMGANGAGDLYRNVSVPKTQRRRGRDIYGVVAEDGNVYWIEIDRSRTVRMKPPTGGLQGTQRM